MVKEAGFTSRYRPAIVILLHARGNIFTTQLKLRNNS